MRSMKVFVGMSGGVDSSVTAALCKQQGHEVTGVYMKNWTQDIAGVECAWRDDLADAKSVAAILDIDFLVFDFEKEYRHRVVDYMVSEYRAGRTPNPDIMCNQEVKFRLFLDAAIEHGADKIATGHYAQAVNGRLLAGKDDSKDQSYFLYRVSAEALEKTLFPLGGYMKSEVRDMAGEFGLPTASKPDSQGICFIGEVSIKEFLQDYIDTYPGPIVHAKTGEQLGEHEGAELYTIGQRQGLGIGGGLPLYVCGKDMGSNTVYVTDDLGELMRREFSITDLHWINHTPEADEEYQVRLRHQGGLSPVSVSRLDEGTAHLSLTEPERAITPGQSAVLYRRVDDGLEVVGGGVVC